MGCGHWLTVITKKDARLTLDGLRGGQVSTNCSRKTNDHHSEKRIFYRNLHNSGKFARAGFSRTNAEHPHGSASCIKKSSFEAVVEVSEKGARREVTLEEDMDITVEPNLGAGSSSIVDIANDEEDGCSSPLP